MRRYQCENCGAELQRDGDYFTCGHCRSVYRDESLEKAYNRVYANLTSTVKDIVTEELMKERMEKIAAKKGDEAAQQNLSACGMSW